MKTISILLLLFVTCNSFAQTENIPVTYLDENLKNTTEEEYQKSSWKSLNKKSSYTKDSTVIHLIQLRSEFGKLNTTENLQIRNHITKITKTLVDGTILINYYPELKSISQTQEHYNNYIKANVTRMTIDSLNTHISTRWHKNKTLKTLSTINSDRKKWITKTTKCLNKFTNKTNAKTYFIYKNENNALEDYTDLLTYKDTGLLESVFFKIPHQYQLLILKPNGEYFLTDMTIKDKTINFLLKKDDWTQIKNQYHKTLTKHIYKGIGHFERFKYEDSVNCFKKI